MSRTDVYEMSERDWERFDEMIAYVDNFLAGEHIDESDCIVDDHVIDGVQNGTLFSVVGWPYEIEFHDSFFQGDPIALAKALLNAARGLPV